MNLDLTNSENRRMLFLAFVGLMFGIILIAGIFTLFDSEEPDPSEDGVTNYLDAPQEAQDVVRSFPVIIDDIEINYSYTDKYFTADYPGYYAIADVENRVISYIFGNTELTEIKVRYGGIKGEVKTYNLEGSDNPEELNFH